MICCVNFLGESRAHIGADGTQRNSFEELGVCSLLGDLLLLLDDLGGDSIHVCGSFLCQNLSKWLLGAVLILVLDLANETSFLELLQAVSDHFTSTLVVLGGADAASLLATVVGLECADANLSSNVELVSN